MNYGFKDMRSAAELMLSPGRPAARTNISIGSLSLNIGASVNIPGVISKATQITGAVRQAMGAAILIKETTQMIGGLVQQTLNDVNQLQGVVTGGVPALAANLTTSIPIPGLPNAQAFLSVSALRAGQTLPASYASILKDRKNQLQGLATRMQSLASMAKHGGVSIQENYKRTPYPLTDEVDKPSVSKLAVGGRIAQQDAVLKDKAKFVVSGLQTAQGKPSFWSRLKSKAQVAASPGFNPALNQVFKNRQSSSGWSEPPSPYAAQFPFNKVTATESGHVFEVDDTPGAERLHMFHRSGSFVEMHPNGTVIYKNMKDGYLITMNNQFVSVAGDCTITVVGKASIFAKKGLNIESDGDINVTTKKDFNVFASNVNLMAKKTFKGDGTAIDLRYIKLPTRILPVMGGLVPSVSVSALKADFPQGNFATVIQAANKGPLDPRTVGGLLKFNEEEVPAPIENPLSNPGIYMKKTAAAVDYRARLFDTPEETQNFEVYTAHVDLQRMLGDISRTADSRGLGGKIITLDESVPMSTPAVTYLDFETYKGRFEYPDDFPISSSFALRDLVDVALFPEIVPGMKTPVPGGSTDIPSDFTSTSETPVDGTRPDVGGSGTGGQSQTRERAQ